MAFTNSERTQAKHGVMDVPSTLNDITIVEDAVQTRFMDRWKTASATGDFNGDGADLFTKVGIETTVTAELAPFGFGGSVASDIRIGVSSELSAYYHQSSLSTHSTELRNTFQVDGTIGRLAESFDNIARYFITPYIYRSQSGALVLDYLVELDGTSMDWWEDNYGQQPDLAFILPWRYATEKGGKDVRISRKQKTNDIQFFHPIVSPGDTVIITTRVHNFSLKTFDDLLKVDYYLGDPAEGGVAHRYLRCNRQFEAQHHDLWCFRSHLRL